MADFKLPPDLLPRIKKSEGDLREAETIIMKAKQAGLDVEAMEQNLKDSQTRLRKFRNVFFPGQ